MQPEIVELSKLGPFPSSDATDYATVEKYAELLTSIKRPITDEEARQLVRLFGPDDFFELAWPLIHTIETAPGWPLEDCLQETPNEWIARLKERVENAKRRGRS